MKWPVLSLFHAGLGILLLVPVASAFAADPGMVDQLSVTLDHLQKIHQQEAGGDELYISVTEFSANEKPRFYQIPAFPSHWNSKNLHDIQQVVLWKKPLKMCEKTTVVFSLVEEDMRPWDSDDLIGSVQLNVTCDGQHIKTQWTVPNTSNTTVLHDKSTGFAFKGSGAQYNAYMNVLTNKIPLKNVIESNTPRIQIRERITFP
jgi:hypothetical protein